MEQTNSSKKTLLIVLVVLAAIAVGASVALHFVNRGPKTGTVNITYNVPDTGASVVKFNNTAVAPTSGSNYAVAPGSYSLSINNPGYKPFSTHLTITKGQTLVVNVVLELGVTPTLTSVNQIPFDNSITTAGVSITQVAYFYQNTWAVVKLNVPPGESEFVVVSYDAGGQKWNLVFGPAQFATTDDTANMPNQVSDYLSNNNYVTD